MARGSTLLLILSIGLMVARAPLRPSPANASRNLVLLNDKESSVREKGIGRGILATLTPRCELRIYYKDIKRHLTETS
jgi:hypothetical protein